MAVQHAPSAHTQKHARLHARLLPPQPPAAVNHRHARAHAIERTNAPHTQSPQTRPRPVAAPPAASHTNGVSCEHTGPPRSNVADGNQQSPPIAAVPTHRGYCVNRSTTVRNGTGPSPFARTDFSAMPPIEGKILRDRQALHARMSACSCAQQSGGAGPV